MTLIESQNINIQKKPSEIFNFLSDLNNHKQLMPNQVENFISTVDSCSFTIKGTGDLSLKTEKTIKDELIKMVPNGKAPFNFDLNWVIKNEGENTRVTALINADMNMFIKMVAEKPLKNFLDFQVNRLKELFND